MTETSRQTSYLRIIVLFIGLLCVSPAQGQTTTEKTQGLSAGTVAIFETINGDAQSTEMVRTLSAKIVKQEKRLNILDQSIRARLARGKDATVLTQRKDLATKRLENQQKELQELVSPTS